jgi:predicted AAA+ superfamily ATPase
MVAIELYRAVNGWNDMGYGDFALHFIKNKEQQEVDFVIVNAGDPVVLIEVKRKERNEIIRHRRADTRACRRFIRGDLRRSRTEHARAGFHGGLKTGFLGVVFMKYE